MAESELHAEVARQIAALDIRRHHPLIVSDADEVIVRFMAGFERYLDVRGLYFTWRSYRLDGNILGKADDAALTASDIHALLDDFFAAHTDSLEPVAGAAAALGALSGRAQIVVLSNLPLAYRENRRRWLVHHGIDYPLVVNIGAKGPAVRALAARAAAPTCFIDDSPTHHETVARDAGHVLRLHFTADDRLARLVGPAQASHHRAGDWASARAIIEAEFAALGH
ncbi:MAG: hypothetical protein ACE5H8_03250 [Alphaproteobacteria bacterium]